MIASAWNPAALRAAEAMATAIVPTLAAVVAVVAGKWKMPAKFPFPARNPNSRRRSRQG
jgi:hypothetical protein